MSGSIIRFDKVNMWFGNDFHVLRDIDLSVAPGERILICRPSGAGRAPHPRGLHRLREHHARNENLRATTTGTRKPLR